MPRFSTGAAPGGSTSPGVSTSTGLTPAATQKGSVGLPAGSKLSFASLTAQNSLGTTSIGKDGTFSLSTFSTDAQFAMITNSSGAPLLTGFLSPSEPVINAHTTAEVYLYFATFVYSLPDEPRMATMASISTLPGLINVENAISAALVANPAAPPSSSAGVQSAMASLVGALATSSAMHLTAASGLASMRGILAAHKPSSLIFAPDNSASGITIVDDNAVPDSIHFQNAYRRFASAYIDEVSHTDQNGNTIPDQKIDTNAPVYINPTTAIAPAVESFINFVKGNFPFYPTESPSIPLPAVPGAKYTTYRIALLGPGFNPGDISQVSLTEGTQLFKTSAIFAMVDVFVPLIASLIVPASKIYNVNTLGGAAPETVFKAFEQFIAVCYGNTELKEAMEKGDTEEVLVIGLKLVTSSAFLQEGLGAGIFALYNITPGSTSAGSTALAEVGEFAEFALEFVNGVIGIANFAILENDVKHSDLEDIFTVNVYPTSVTLLPSASLINAGTALVLTASAHDPDLTVVYSYTNTAKFGHLTDNTGAGHMDNFTSSSPTVTYTGGANAAGTDTIGVTASLVVNNARQALGAASATVTVRAVPTVVTVAPQYANLANGQSLAITASITPKPAPGAALTYYWTQSIAFPTFSSDVGHITDPVSGKQDNFSTTSATVTYAAPASGSAIVAETVQAFIGTTPLGASAFTEIAFGCDMFTSSGPHICL